MPARASAEPYEDLPLLGLVHDPSHQPGVYFGNQLFVNIYPEMDYPRTEPNLMWVYNLGPEEDRWGFMPDTQPYWHRAEGCSKGGPM